jgi:hypothetical protein
MRNRSWLVASIIRREDGHRRPVPVCTSSAHHAPRHPRHAVLHALKNLHCAGAVTRGEAPRVCFVLPSTVRR